VSRIQGESGFSLVEMLTVMVILGIVIGGLATLFEQGSNAEVSMNNRYQAQLNARLGLDKLRRDLHCASGPHTGTTPTATLVTLDVPCVASDPLNPSRLTYVSWCTASSGGRYGLFRNFGTTCTSTNTRFIDKLVNANVFVYEPAWNNSLARLHVDLQVNTASRTTRTVDLFELCDVIVLRNSTRTGGASQPTLQPATTPAC